MPNLVAILEGLAVVSVLGVFVCSFLSIRLGIRISNSRHRTPRAMRTMALVVAGFVLCFSILGLMKTVPRSVMMSGDDPLSAAANALYAAAEPLVVSLGDAFLSVFDIGNPKY